MVQQYYHKQLLETTRIYYLTTYLLSHHFCVSGMYVQQSWVLCLRVSQSSTQGIGQRGGFILDLMGDGSACRLTQLAEFSSCRLLDTGLQFLAGCQLESALSLLPCGPLHMALTALQLVSSKAVRKIVFFKTGIIALCNVIMYT